MRATGIPLVLTLALSLGAAGTAQAQWRYRVGALEAPPGSADVNGDRFALGLDSYGVVLGFPKSLDDSAPLRAFVSDNGPARDLGTLGGLATVEVQDVHHPAQVASPDRVDGPQRAFDAPPMPQMNGWALLLAGLGGIGIVVSHRRRYGP